MTWKIVGRSDTGSAMVFGGDDLDKVSRLFSGVTDVDTLDIDSSVTIRSGKFKLRNPANTFSYNFVQGAITANRQITWPTCTTDDQVTFDIHPTTIYNKAFGLGTSVVDGQDIALGSTTGTKIGTATTQKLGFWGKAPVTQPVANPDTSGATLANLEIEVNQIKALLRLIGAMA